MSIYAVNGKTPIAAWIPSRDDVGNGTTTLTDLVGSNNGTLTNMDPATDWVADTDAGGVRALDFDGVNDYISMGSPASLRLTGAMSVSAWVYPRSLNRLAIAAHATSATAYFILMFSFGSNQRLSFWNTAASPAVTAGSISALNQWHHFAAVRNVSGVELFLNGVTAGTAGVSFVSGTSAAEMTLGRFGSFNSYMSSSRLDDIRIFDAALDATDVADLYAAGLGRGITFGGTIQTRRRRQLGGYGL